MAIHDIARNLPFLRRFARALTGSTEAGDALVAATLQSLIDGRVVIDRSAPDRTALFAALWRNRATQIALEPVPIGAKRSERDGSAPLFEPGALPGRSEASIRSGSGPDPRTAGEGAMDPAEARLHALAPLERAAFLLVMVEQVDEAEAARILETSPAQVRALMSGIRERFHDVQFPKGEAVDVQIRVPNRSG